ncbi:DUF1521 domain-containing protein [Parasphingorhabdus cellanae]|uniref:DUF1521 domain-containing protein n=1 Tax=Parasphingorhabdus cellanae TaxID=2806553 RepID=A0ABX7T3N5_9SPHN|nr:DUF1521 domain-containing protein [Parasphingorhabdus cellanae]QTD56146.1 DUF1521 domain-containing protein [Parasphingorhabdus cellanae]
MTPTNPAQNNFLTLASPLTPVQLMNGMQLNLAAGIMGQFFNPLNAGPFAGGMLPMMLGLRCFSGMPGCGVLPGGCIPPFTPCPMPDVQPQQQWTAQMTGTGTADVDLGDGYTLQFNEKNSEIFILNENTGEKTRIWGDPHVDVDGKRAFDFWGTTTFTLENGTKITINTEQWNGNPNMYVASQVVVTKGSNALVVDGISQNQLGDLEMTMSNNGYSVDAAHRDGYVLHENDCGSGWNSELTGELATQQDLNATRPGGEYGPGSELPSLGELGSFLGNFLMFGMLFNLPQTDAAQAEFARLMPQLFDA